MLKIVCLCLTVMFALVGQATQKQMRYGGTKAEVKLML